MPSALINRNWYKGGYFSNPVYTGSFIDDLMDLASILVVASPGEAKATLHEIVKSKTNLHVRAVVPLRLLGMDDLYGFDALVKEMMDAGHDRNIRVAIFHELCDTLNGVTVHAPRFYDSQDIEKFYQWYQANREKLKWSYRKGVAR